MQCGLSGNLVPIPVTVWSNAVKGNRPDGDILVHCWENLLDLKPQCLPGVLPPVLLYIVQERERPRGGRLSLFIVPEDNYFLGGWKSSCLIKEIINKIGKRGLWPAVYV